MIMSLHNSRIIGINGIIWYEGAQSSLNETRRGELCVGEGGHYPFTFVPCSWLVLINVK